ncbi:hypothetical protein BH11VER1_BH11VER1_31780 [soil metagenome]
MAGYQFYRQKGMEVGNYFLDSLMADIDSLILFAGVHRKVFGFHVMLSRRFPFAVYYKIEADMIRVRRVLDCRRDPDWIRRSIKEI